MFSSLRTGALSAMASTFVRSIGPFSIHRLCGFAQIVVLFHVGHEAFDAFAAGGVILLEPFGDVALGGDHGLDVVAQERAQLVANGELLRIAHGDGERVVGKLERHNAVELGHGLGDFRPARRERCSFPTSWPRACPFARRVPARVDRRSRSPGFRPLCPGDRPGAAFVLQAKARAGLQ